ncbi:hypothetical protein FB45DRAFT_836333 [Roridomyces roridus]|uniref:Uncharacterized protein n=1 Tax=Roridomyces roridus TaxID=1738132 RepID=A0AAD7BNG0_9AGAR|nr:hypothetical protein FB45DRAFT_836333 [Roridomyces roridus]
MPHHQIRRPNPPFFPKQSAMNSGNDNFAHISPYAMWSSPNSSRQTSSNNPNPSVHGALPFAADPTRSNNLHFHFTAFNPTILNCTVVGKNTVPYYKIVTDDSMRGYTVVKNLEDKTIALVEWKQHPLVEIRKIVPKQRVGENPSHRRMTGSEQDYVWAPRKNAICLYPADTLTPELLAQILLAPDGTVSLEITQAAVSAGLVERCVLATLLLQCGRKID